MRADVDTMLAGLKRIDEIRGEVDGGFAGRLRAIETFGLVNDSIYQMNSSLAIINDIPIYQQARVMILLGYAKELLSREQAIIAVTATSRMTEEEHKLFTQLDGHRRFLIDQALPEPEESLRRTHVNLISTPQTQRLRIPGEQIGAADRPGPP